MHLVHLVVSIHQEGNPPFVPLMMKRENVMESDYHVPMSTFEEVFLYRFALI